MVTVHLPTGTYREFSCSGWSPMDSPLTIPVTLPGWSHSYASNMSSSGPSSPSSSNSSSGISSSCRLANDVTWTGSAYGSMIDDPSNHTFSVDATTRNLTSLAIRSILTGLASNSPAQVLCNKSQIGTVTLGTLTARKSIVEFYGNGGSPMSIKAGPTWSTSCLGRGITGSSSNSSESTPEYGILAFSSVDGNGYGGTKNDSPPVAANNAALSMSRGNPAPPLVSFGLEIRQEIVADVMPFNRMEFFIVDRAKRRPLVPLKRFPKLVQYFSGNVMSMEGLCIPMNSK